MRKLEGGIAMKVYQYGYVETDFTEKARKEAESSLHHYQKVLASLYENSEPGSVTRTVGIPKTQREIERLEYFLSQF